MNQAQLESIAEHLSVRLGMTREDAEAAIVDAIGGTEADEQCCSHAATFTQRTPQSLIDEERPIGYVRVPFFSKSEHAAPLRRVVTHVADSMGVSHFLAAKLLTHAWQAIAEEIGRGNIVRVPGWGVYGPWLWTGKDGRRAVYPRFVAARPFRQQVRDCCTPEKSRNDVLRTFQRSHHPSSRPDQSTTRTFTTMKAWRDDIDRQAGCSIRGED